MISVFCSCVVCFNYILGVCVRACLFVCYFCGLFFGFGFVWVLEGLGRCGPEGPHSNLTLPFVVWFVFVLLFCFVVLSWCCLFVVVVVVGGCNRPTRQPPPPKKKKNKTKRQTKKTCFPRLWRHSWGEVWQKKANQKNINMFFFSNTPS